MNTKRFIFLSAIALITGLWAACSIERPQPTAQNLQLPEVVDNYEGITYPQSFKNKPDNTPIANPITNHGATLGRVLFYDGRLSLNGTTSCASCHHQSKAFSDVTAQSVGFKGDLTKRNSMPIFNMQFLESFFWDSRVNRLEDQVIMPVADHIEMGIDKEEVLIAKLGSAKYYPQLFENAFGDETISMERIQNALAQFVRSIASYNSKFDEGVKNEFANFTAKELEGLHLFTNAQCQSCHALEGIEQLNILNNGDLIENSLDDISFFGDSQANIGLEKVYEDKGMYEVTGSLSDVGRFKIPNLRNLELTGPYMHDGRFATLEDVLLHYNEKIEPHRNLDFRLKSGVGNTYEDAAPTGNGQPVQFDFNKEERDALIAFFKTLTDQQLITDDKYSNPFN